MKSKATLTFLICLFFNFTHAQQNNLQLGYALSWEGHPYNAGTNFIPFFEEISTMSSNCLEEMVVFGNAAWRDSLESAGSLPATQNTIGGLTAIYDYTPMLGFAWKAGETLLLNTESNPTNNWTNQNAKDLYLEMLLEAAANFPDAYIFIGNEVNFYWEQDSVDYLNWVDFYHWAYDSIKTTYPNATIGTIFNFEHLSGQGVLTGWDTSYWQALTSFNLDKIDVLGLTVYPFFNHATADLVPSGYLQQLIDTVGIDQRIAITETGWPVDNLLPFTPLWTPSIQQQEAYVPVLFNSIVANNDQIEVVNWLYLNYLMDYNANIGHQIFASVSMRDSSGNDYPSLELWKNYCAEDLGFTDLAINNSNIVVYPNPVNDVLHISVNDFPATKYYLYDMFGKLFSEAVIHSDTIDLDVSNLKGGIYRLLFSDGNGQVEQVKLVVN